MDIIMNRDHDIIIREASAADAHGIARVHVDAWCTTYTGIMPDSVLEALSYDEDEKKQKDMFKHPRPGSKTFVAEVEPDGIVGFASGGNAWHRGLRQRRSRIYKGELFLIYILEACQRMGIGTMLVHRVINHIKSLGLENMIIWVLEENSACKFYEKLGGIRVDEKMTERGGKQLKEIAYSWDDIDSFRA
ncbi:MAG TPA: GNAT family N-acetyltransferase [Candidatus Lokiarchaeia archaeon]|nr:GNAT family N-acetyltransferase [Candidatus Lokiarchaeia archaeon]